MALQREGVWTDCAEDHRPAPTDWRRLGLEGFGIAFVAGTAAAFALPVGLGLPIAAVVGGGGTFGLLARHADDRRRAARAGARVLRDEFGVGPVWVVDLMVRQGDAPTGCDQGLMWIEGGRMMFSGLRTSFAVVPAQTAGPVGHDPGLAGLRHRLNLPLDRQTPGGPLSLSFWPIAESLRGAESDAASLRYALNTIFGGRWSPMPETAGQWPPLAIGPGAPPPRSLFVRALLRVVGWSLVATAPASAFLALSPWIGLLALVVLVALANGAILRENAPRWRAYRDARRLWP